MRKSSQTGFNGRLVRKFSVLLLLACLSAVNRVYVAQSDGAEYVRIFLGIITM